MIPRSPTKISLPCLSSPARRFPFPGAGGLLLSALLIGMCGLSQSHAQAKKRCDLLVKSTPGAGADSACLDLVSLANGGPAIQTANNATRISRDGLRFCKNAFAVKTSAEADVVFIFDNSGSMFAQAAWVNPATNDTMYYYNAQGCTDKTVTGTFTMNNANVPLVCSMLASNVGCTNYSGDPYEVRANVIRAAIDYMAATSPTSTAAITGFAQTTMHELGPVQLNNPANVKQVKDSAIIDSIGATYYGPPILLANRWLNDASLTKTAKHAIVFISDGAPSDANGRNSYLNSVDLNIPIYSIFLGQVSTPDTANLKQLSDMTGGTFNRVEPKNIAAINQVMQSIIQSLLVSTLPRSVEVSNLSLAPPQISRSLNLTRNADSSISVNLDSIIALNLGTNNFQVKIGVNDTLSRTYNFKVQADGPEAPASTSSLTCYDPPTLVMLNPQGKQDSVYAPGPVTYQVKLTRSTSDLGDATVMAVSKDSLHAQPWGDAESIRLALAGGGNVYQGSTPLSGEVNAPAAGNNKLESDANGKVILNWVHPRDPREFATYTLPGRKVPTIQPFITVERVVDVTKGSVINKPITDPVVIFGGATLVHVTGDSSKVTHGGCLSNCTGDAVAFADPQKNPSFVFKTASPFTYEVKVYDNLGNFVNTSKGAIDAAKWQTMPKSGDSVTVVMSILPVASNGALIGSGVYILSASILTQATTTHDSKGNEVKVSANSHSIVNRFGYLRAHR
jgi:hypothetical protein